MNDVAGMPALALVLFGITLLLNSLARLLMTSMTRGTRRSA